MKILFIDDNQALQQAFQQFAEPLGHTTRYATTAEEARSILLSGFRPNVILVDIMLRGQMTGVEFIQGLTQRNPGRKKLPIVVLTSGSDVIPGLPTDIPVMRKPVDPDIILDVLQQTQDKSDVISGTSETGSVP